MSNDQYDSSSPPVSAILSEQTTTRKYEIQYRVADGEKFYLDSKTADVHFVFDSAENERE